MRSPLVFQWPEEAAKVQVALRQGNTVVLCIPQASGGNRPTARASVRQALQTALGGWLDCPPASVVLQSAPGSPVQLQSPPAPGLKPGLSISHEHGLSLAAIAPQGPVGVDLLATSALPNADECLRLAQDYLGPQASQSLAALPVAQRASAFARAWTAWEARLKCVGTGLDEWDRQSAPTPCDCCHVELKLPMGFAGSLAWTPAPSPGERHCIE
ncbi:4'-phosphopantetheinyl transferase superfamily protein [uncultured Rhodoferax sp.]|uniref:4'-phosphopantetheinyl transferase family protein n=1 Tax=uncultured Rhodoferax sp. TaxID=223188 RepID=UPI0025E88DE1|nr:4'-phosphopantetheinyl transferase superfamily protein [uncultured Rhodoferax sp.]